MKQPMLNIKNIETYYDRILALKGISLSIENGSVTAVLGNNGAGKTTILQTVIGLLDDQPEKGSIFFQGRDITGKETVDIVKMGIGYVPEGREVFQELSVLENLMAGGYMHNSASAKETIEKVYRYFPVLKERQKQMAGTLSGGEQQMLAISRALMNRPQLLFLDEPSLGLSPLLVDQLFDIIHQIAKDGLTVLLVEQNANKALAIADYGYILENGRFVASGTVEQLKRDEDVQEFYLGIKAEESVRATQRYKRKRRWN
ncbi:branched-chain amino acid transport system ATP-binding protein [Flagellimonas meridianipacifica]|uniref:Branched-chain amino acid transport system ATP-binding protein n=2 Tax=Flagellimonas meridianipacifica TaxID=1080225 RepID=A0A2T0MEV6_9FLAO|nr:ABC transporter ATP-binding protein [Allomuricauda pacifica]PRX56094.1 branched-chain amino acid transport system ATP-binding protein [Allomuricauda pacifica]